MTTLSEKYLVALRRVAKGDSSAIDDMTAAWWAMTVEEGEAALLLAEGENLVVIRSEGEIKALSRYREWARARRAAAE